MVFSLLHPEVLSISPIDMNLSGSVRYRAVRWHSVAVVNQRSKVSFHTSWVFPSTNHKIPVCVIQLDAVPRPGRRRTPKVPFYSWCEQLNNRILTSADLHKFRGMTFPLINAEFGDSHLGDGEFIICYILLPLFTSIFCQRVTAHPSTLQHQTDLAPFPQRHLKQREKRGLVRLPFNLDVEVACAWEEIET